GYFHSSLRDENPQILVASPVLGRSSRRRGPAQENYPGIRLIGARCARGRAHSVQALLHWIVLFLLLTPPTHLIAQEIESGPGFTSRALTMPSTGKAGFTRLPASLTGITVTNRLSDAEAAANQIRMNGSGVAAGDVDGDGRCDLYFCGLEGGNRLYRN